MKIRKLKPYEVEFCELNPEIIEIQYYPKIAKKHRTSPSIFKIQKGYALIFSKKILRAFNKCQIVSIIEHRGSKDIKYDTLKQAIVGGD